MKDYIKDLAEMTKQKENADRQLLRCEIFIGIIATAILLVLIFVAAFVQLEVWLRIFLIALGFIAFIGGILCALKIEQIAGYYKCSKCGHTHIPTYSNILWTMHIGRTRYINCPKCNKYSWHKKVLRND